MAWWGRRGFSSALRWTAVTTAGVAGIAGVQALALHARYDPLPDARGPTRHVPPVRGRVDHPGSEGAGCSAYCDTHPWC